MRPSIDNGHIVAVEDVRNNNYMQSQSGTHFELNVMLISGCVGSSLDEFWGYRVDWYLFFVAESCFAGRGP